ncbi:MAG TPA: S8 family peptidase [Ohtaekwangia sp.]|nr:S8 family peptidase [Ohtaekwangia sp.]
MLKRMIRVLLVVMMGILLNPAIQVYGMYEFQDTTLTPRDWFLRDPETDKVQGLSVERTYETLLKGKPSRTVLVAVIDSGIDIEHEDLKDVLWINEDEIPENGIDDDKNGYVDDIHGWNFIGGKEGNVDADTYEVTREYARLKPKYENFDEKDLNKKNKAEYEYWKRVKTKYERDSKFNKEQFDQYNQQFELYTNALATIKYCDSILTVKLGAPVSKSSLASIAETNDTIMFAKQTLTKVLENVQGDIAVNEFVTELAAYLEQLNEGVEHYRVAVEYGYNTEFNSRTIVGDDINNLKEKGYGNNDVEGPDASHGTHVAGIIAANRKNEIGINGIADNVRIMSVRAVPNGDERDKDVANAIIYAVDNGAQIINMSFGKSFSPQKEVVDKAVKYAESKGVLLIHAAGNDGKNLDEEQNYPTKKVGKGEIKTWLEIGASAAGAEDELVGSFSNYGKKSVDLFAPGVEIYSTTPDNTYKEFQGTSMASPATAGVAAIIMSYFPHLDAEQVRDVLRKSTRTFDELNVSKPGDDEPQEVKFTELSSTGGIVNAYEAVKLASTIPVKTPKK